MWILIVIMDRNIHHIEFESLEKCRDANYALRESLRHMPGLITMYVKK